jgi:xanthine dehydrogenase YagR molybdenum-binding subunit
MLTREGVYRVVGGRDQHRAARGHRRAADGRFDALIHTGTVTMTEHNNMPEPFILPARSAYAAGSFKLDVEVATLDMLANTFMRAPGEAVGTFALESAIDELAHAHGDGPDRTAHPQRAREGPDHGRAFLVAPHRPGLPRRRRALRLGRRSATPGTRREGEWLVGMGCATATYPYYRMPGGAARITLDKDGHAMVEIAAHEMGMGTATAQTQVTAERLGLPMEKVKFCHGDSRFPGVVLAGGSQQTASIGSAVMAAQHALVCRAAEAGGKDSPLHGLKPDDVVGRDGGLGKATSRRASTAMRPSWRAPAATSWSSRPARRPRWKCSTGRCIRTAPCSARCG